MANDKYKVQAKDIYLDLKRFKTSELNDSGLLLFSIIKNIQTSDTEKVFEEYKKILSGENLIIEVLSATELNSDQKEKLVSGVSDKITDKELIFHFVIDPKVKGGIIVRNNDDLIDLSMGTSIDNIQINS